MVSQSCGLLKSHAGAKPIHRVPIHQSEYLRPNLLRLTEVSPIHRLDEGAWVAGVNVDSIEKTKEEWSCPVLE